MTIVIGADPLAYSIEEACRVTSLGRTMIFRAINEGQLATRKVGRRRIIMAESLRAFLEMREG